MGNRVIYEPRGKAIEFAPLAATIYSGCVHACRYCFVPRYRGQSPQVLHRDREVFHDKAVPVKDVLKHLERVAEKMAGDPREILLSFSSDPYPPTEMDAGVTRTALKILIKNNLTFTVLTKAGHRAMRDFELMAGYSNSAFGSTIVFFDQNLADYWEPNVIPIATRIACVAIAKRMGIKTWVSLEPVIYISEALTVLRELAPYVDHWKIGKANYISDIEGPDRETYSIEDWVNFREICKEHIRINHPKATIYIKKSLAEMGE